MLTKCCFQGLQVQSKCLQSELGHPYSECCEGVPCSLLTPLTPIFAPLLPGTPRPPHLQPPQRAGRCLAVCAREDPPVEGPDNRVLPDPIRKGLGWPRGVISESHHPTCLSASSLPCSDVAHGPSQSRPGSFLLHSEHHSELGVGGCAVRGAGLLETEWCHYRYLQPFFRFSAQQPPS